jgi:hypothetical protein
MVMIDPRLRSIMPGRKVFDRQERGGQVAVDVGLPFLLGDVEDRLGPAATAGECGQHVDRAELLLDVDAHGLECGGVGAVGRGRHRVGAVGAELGDDRVDGGSGRVRSPATLAWSAASARQVAAPSPREPPVTTATFPARSG